MKKALRGSLPMLELLSCATTQTATEKEAAKRPEPAAVATALSVPCAEMGGGVRVKVELVGTNLVVTVSEKSGRCLRKAGIVPFPKQFPAKKTHPRVLTIAPFLCRTFPVLTKQSFVGNSYQSSVPNSIACLLDFAPWKHTD